MPPDKRRIDRLRRLERLRAIAKQQAAGESAQAERVLAQLNELTARTRGLAEEYAARGDAIDGYMLTQSSRFAAGLCKIMHSTNQEAGTAQAHADRKKADLVSAERRRAAVEDRLTIEERALSRREDFRHVEAKSKIGTELD